MNAVQRLTKRIRPELQAAGAALAHKNITVALVHLERATDLCRAVTKRSPRKVLVLPGATKAERDEERSKRAAEIRAAVMERAAGVCEWCSRDGYALEWAHVIDGNGDKQAHEAVDTTAAACFDCHRRGWHGSGARREKTLRDAKEWALRLGFRKALAEIDRKIAKVTEARGSVRIAVEGA
jgi:hypothetical protein